MSLFSVRPLLTYTFLSAGTLLGAGACTPHNVRDTAQLNPVEIPEQFQEAAQGEAAPVRWYLAFNDAQLNQMQQRMLDHNLDLAAAAARFEQARATAQAQGSTHWPQLSASIGAQRNKSVFNFGGGGPIGVTNNNFSASLAASYEVDVWGKVTSAAQAADADAFASALDMQSLAMSLSATLTDSWFSLLEQQALAQLIETQITTNTEQLSVLEARFHEGLGGAIDVLQQKDALLRSQSQLPLVHQRIAQLQHQIAVLLREPPSEGAAAPGAELPSLPTLPGVPLPATLLDQRPDVRAAQLRLRAADYRIAVAISERLPGLTLNGTFGLQAFSLADFFQSTVWSIAASISGSIFDGGRRSAEVERTKAVVQERIATLGQVTLNALREVEDALSRERYQQQYVEALEGQLSTATQLLSDTRTRYEEGIGDYLPVLTALRQLQTLEQQIVGARRQLLTERVQLYRALGGDWSEQMGAAGRQDLRQAAKN